MIKAFIHIMADKIREGCQYLCKRKSNNYTLNENTALKNLL